MLRLWNSGWDLQSIRSAFSILNIAKSSKGIQYWTVDILLNIIPTIHPFCVSICLWSPESNWWCLGNTSRHAIHTNLLKRTSEHSNNYTAALNPCYWHSTRIFLCCCLLKGAWTICPGLLHIWLRGKHTTKSVSLLFALVAGPERPVYSFLTDAERTDGSESDRAGGGLRGLGFCRRTLSFLFKLDLVVLTLCWILLPLILFPRWACTLNDKWQFKCAQDLMSSRQTRKLCYR